MRTIYFALVSGVAVVAVTSFANAQGRALRQIQIRASHQTMLGCKPQYYSRKELD